MRNMYLSRGFAIILNWFIVRSISSSIENTAGGCSAEIPCFARSLSSKVKPRLVIGFCRTCMVGVVDPDHGVGERCLVRLRLGKLARSITLALVVLVSAKTVVVFII